MNSKSRTYNVYVNTVANISGQILTLLLSFLTRMVFIHVFGENYLGINGLFSNILSVLSLAELGVGSAIVYCMYKPIAEKNHKQLAALISYYRKLYRMIGGIVAFIGLAITPFLKYIVHIDADIGNVTIYYLLYLLNTVSSYFLVYKTSILIADQRSYIIKICTVTTSIIQFIVLSIVAFIFENFYVYLSLQIGFLILNNYICSKIAEKKYPFICKKEELTLTEKKDIWSSILSMFSYQVGNVVLNNTDNILISIIVNTVVVGFYSNYSMVILSVSTFLQLIFTSMQASIGNLAAEGGNSKQYEIFNVIQLMSFWLTAFCCVSFAVLFQDFISILYTDHFLLDYKVVIVCIFNFYIQFILYPIYCYRNTVGLFKQTRWVMVFTSIINIVLSIFMGMQCGLIGILAATGISRLLTNFWYEPIKLFKNYFSKPVCGYFIKQIFYVLCTCVMVFSIVCLTNLMNDINIYLRFGLKIIICVLVPNIVFYIIFRKNRSFKFLKNKIIGKTRK